MDRVEHKDLKWGIYTSPQCDEGVTFQRYIIENKQDLLAFANKFPEIKKIGNVFGSMAESIGRGQIVIATDRHGMSGFPTWCYESQIDKEHPSAMIRVAVGEEALFDVEDLTLYYVSEPENENRTRRRLTQMAELGMEEIGIASFGIRNVMSGLYIEKVWNLSDEEFEGYMLWVGKMLIESKC